jgi:hypothetical protein
MRTILAACGIVLVMGIIVHANFSNTVEVMKTETLEVIKEVEPDWAVDEDAVKAAQDVIRRKELEAELSALEANFEATVATYEANKAEYKAKKEQLQKDLNIF